MDVLERRILEVRRFEEALRELIGLGVEDGSRAAQRSKAGQSREKNPDGSHGTRLKLALIQRVGSCPLVQRFRGRLRNG